MSSAWPGRKDAVSTITTDDGTRIDYKDCGLRQPVVFSHGGPLSADAWEDQMVPMDASAMPTARMIERAVLKVHPGLSHGTCSMHEDRIHADLLACLATSEPLRRNT